MRPLEPGQATRSVPAELLLTSERTPPRVKAKLQLLKAERLTDILHSDTSPFFSTTQSSPVPRHPPCQALRRPSTSTSGSRRTATSCSLPLVTFACSRRKIIRSWLLEGRMLGAIITFR